MESKVLAIVEALQHWQPYSHDKKFIVHTDHSPLTYFFTQPNLSPANYAGLKIFFNFFYGVVFSTLRYL